MYTKNRGCSGYYDVLREMLLRQMMQAYEERPEDTEVQDAIMKTARYGGGHSMKCYSLWLVRSALYGNWKAQKALERYAVYKKISLIPEWMMAPPDSRREEKQKRKSKDNTLDVDGWELRRAGFGREDDYETVYLDEFFNFVGLETENQKPEELKEKLCALEARRKRYWESPLHDRRRRGIYSKEREAE